MLLPVIMHLDTGNSCNEKRAESLSRNPTGVEAESRKQYTKNCYQHYKHRPRDPTWVIKHSQDNSNLHDS